MSTRGKGSKCKNPSNFGQAVFRLRMQTCKASTPSPSQAQDKHQPQPCILDPTSLRVRGRSGLDCKQHFNHLPVLPVAPKSVHPCLCTSTSWEHVSPIAKDLQVHQNGWIRSNVSFRLLRFIHFSATSPQSAIFDASSPCLYAMTSNAE